MHKIIQNSKMTADKSSFLNKQKQQQKKKSVLNFYYPCHFQKQLEIGIIYVLI